MTDNANGSRPAPKRKKPAPPSVYSDELATIICKRMSEGQSLRTICNDDWMPDRNTVMDWLLDPRRETFHRQYAIAREKRADFLFEETLEIAADKSNDFDGDGRGNTAAVMRARLQIETRKWFLSKLFPRRYGNLLDQGEGGQTLEQLLLAIEERRKAKAAAAALPAPGPGANTAQTQQTGGEVIDGTFTEIKPQR